MTDDDDELRWRLDVLKAQIEEGKIHIAPHLFEAFKQSLGAIRHGADGKVDLATVDRRVRSMSLVTAHVEQRRQAKQAMPLRDIQQAYFEFVEDTFGGAYKQMRDRNLDPHTFSLGASRDTDFVKRASSEIPVFIEALADFWVTAADATHYQIQDLQSNKGVFGGDLFPSYENNIASSAGLYLDTIVLADPFLRSKEVFSNASPEEAIRYMFKHGLSVLGYKELALANVDPPIVVIAPNQSSLDGRERDFLLRIGNEDALKHANATFLPQFGSPEELIEFGKSLDTIEKVVKELRDPTRLLFDTEWKGSPADQIERALKHRSNFVGIESPGIMAVGTCFGRMTQATDALFESRFLGGTPLIQAETSWRYLTWKLEYNASTDSERHTMLAIKGLQHAQENDMEWLGNIPPHALIEMRRTGALDEVRAILFKANMGSE
jgi:hypothetical protein